MSDDKVYDDGFWEMNARHARLAAGPIIRELLRWVQPRTAVDVGCGQGIIAKALSENNVVVTGIDSGWVPIERMQLPLDSFVQMDFEKDVFPIDGSWGLGLFLEVAEHLSEQAAEKVIEFLVRKTSIALFSAATPRQGGYGHVNERWPSHWIEKFVQKGWVADGRIRAALWNEQTIPCYYRQNLLLFHDGGLAAIPTSSFTQDVIHPQLFLDKMEALSARR